MDGDIEKVYLQLLNTGVVEPLAGILTKANFAGLKAAVATLGEASGDLEGIVSQSGATVRQALDALHAHNVIGWPTYMHAVAALAYHMAKSGGKTQDMQEAELRQAVFPVLIKRVMERGEALEHYLAETAQFLAKVRPVLGLLVQASITYQLQNPTVKQLETANKRLDRADYALKIGMQHLSEAGEAIRYAIETGLSHESALRCVTEGAALAEIAGKLSYTLSILQKRK